MKKTILFCALALILFGCGIKNNFFEKQLDNKTILES